MNPNPAFPAEKQAGIKKTYDFLLDHERLSKEEAKRITRETHKCSDSAVWKYAISFRSKKNLKTVNSDDSQSAATSASPKTEEEAAEEASIGKLRRKVDNLKSEVAILKDENRELAEELEQSKIYRELFSKLEDYSVEPPDWLRKERKGNQKLSMPSAILSDLHLDEVVFPEQIGYVNAYNREIALERLRLFFENVVELSSDYITGLRYEGFVLNMLGDTFSGFIHEELARTNADTMFGSLLFWIDPVMAGLKMLADAFGKVYVPFVPGNHGRMSRKPQSKNRAADNLDSLFGKLLQKFNTDPRIIIHVSESADYYYQIYKTRFGATHGDQFRGGSGIAGLMSPLMLGDHRKRSRQQAVQQPYDVLLMGHWHQLLFLGKMIINGSLKGYDEYAFTSNFAFEPPQQAFFVTDPDYGVTITAPVHCVGKSEVYTPHFASERSIIFS